MRWRLEPSSPSRPERNRREFRRSRSRSQEGGRRSNLADKDVERRADYHAPDPRKVRNPEGSGQDIRNLDLLPETESVVLPATTLRFMTEASASATLVDTLRPLIKDQTINSRKLVGPYRTKAEMKTDTERKTGNNSDVSLISDFDPDGSPVKEILRSVPGAMSMPDLSESSLPARVPTREEKVPMKPISPKPAVVRQEADLRRQSGLPGPAGNEPVERRILHELQHVSRDGGRAVAIPALRRRTDLDAERSREIRNL